MPEIPDGTPEYEQWLYRNPDAMELVQRGLQEAAAGLGQVVDFSHYDDEDYAPSPPGSHVLTEEQAIEFERRQAEPPREPTEAEREAVRVFNATVRRS